MKLLGINGLDGVLLTHTHYDHAMDALGVIDQVGGVLYGSESAANLAKGAGLSKEEFRVVKPNSEVNIGKFIVKWLNSQHIPFLPPLGWFMPKSGRINQPLSTPCYFWEYQCGAVYAVVIDHLLVFGSAGFIPDVYRSADAQVVVLSIGGLETKPFPYLEKLYQETVVDAGAQQVLVSHWDNFFKPISNNGQTLGLAKTTINHLQRLGKRNGQVVKVLYPGETVKL